MSCGGAVLWTPLQPAPVVVERLGGLGGDPHHALAVAQKEVPRLRKPDAAVPPLHQRPVAPEGLRRTPQHAPWAKYSQEIDKKVRSKGEQPVASASGP